MKIVPGPAARVALNIAVAAAGRFTEPTLMVVNQSLKREGVGVYAAGGVTGAALAVAAR